MPARFLTNFSFFLPCRGNGAPTHPAPKAKGSYLVRLLYLILPGHPAYSRLQACSSHHSLLAQALQPTQFDLLVRPCFLSPALFLRTGLLDPHPLSQVSWASSLLLLPHPRSYTSGGRSR